MSSSSAPQVSYPVGRSRFLGALLLGGWALAVLVTAAWWMGSSASAGGPLLGAALCVLSGVCLLLGWQRLPVGSLQWDGRDWTWQSAGYQTPTLLAAPEPLLDLQGLLLMRMHNRAGAPWLVWADAAAAPAHWLDLRRALYARPHNEGVATDPSGRDARP